MPRVSAGLLCWRRRGGRLEVLVVHPGGPRWEDRDEGVWSIPKGELEPGEAPLEAAFREFEEETGFPRPRSPLIPLGTVVQRSGKIVHAFAAEHDVDPSLLRSCTVEVEWPKGSGRLRRVPEVDRAAWCEPGRASALLKSAQVELVGRLERALAAGDRKVTW